MSLRDSYSKTKALRPHLRPGLFAFLTSSCRPSPIALGCERGSWRYRPQASPLSSSRLRPREWDLRILPRASRSGQDFLRASVKR